MLGVNNLSVLEKSSAIKKRSRNHPCEDSTLFAANVANTRRVQTKHAGYDSPVEELPSPLTTLEPQSRFGDKLLEI